MENPLLLKVLGLLELKRAAATSRFMTAETDKEDYGSSAQLILLKDLHDEVLALVHSEEEAAQ